MGTTIEKLILAIVTTKPDHIAGGAPVFVADTKEEFTRKAFVLEKILDGMAHEVDPHTMIIVRHS
ncbi:hypothetical protein ACFO25_02835 [Paenactinomyces guangxiensis]|uniref:Uncharacterized protein n=1 Tax=Paenactinomyces guangxiensis TaxID=1490290 RepID=A0A7W2A9U9_9BACL|nr:hypothetical protein [Paenactinomyces guangxiensis]MBA4495619.1 hypothetical protein [Paenactinomyces guangxiensis]MBH8592607.1 hypothetical protein [Paenactinomyces guangxiensis]